MTLRALIEQRIRDTVPEFRDVGGGADIKAILAATNATPAAYVYRERNTAKANNAISAVAQQRVETIGILVITRNVRDARGGANADDSEALCDLIEAQLLGYSPDDERYNRLEYIGGDLVLLKDGFHIWREAYQASRVTRRLVPPRA